MPESTDLKRLQDEYATRHLRLAGSDIYSYFNVANQFIIQQRQRTLLKCLRQYGFYPIQKRNILELGCGLGGVLLEFLSFGATIASLHGAELLFERLQVAHKTLTRLPLVCADGQELPYATCSFDLSMQFTVFSSILDETIKSNLAREMLRVTRPGGLILWYDFWLNPTNPQTRGIRPSEVRRLFPNCTIEFHKITLAPPIARRVVPFSWGFAFFLESLKIFNTHYLATIQPRPNA